MDYRRTVSRRRTERLVNLVLCLMSTRRFLTAGQIARTVGGYEHDPTDFKAHEAFQRMFERDKAQLRELGIPLETGTSSVFDVEPGYRIAPAEYALPEIELAPDEAAAVALAARWWRDAGLASAATSGLRKLVAGGAEVASGDAFAIEPAIAPEPTLEPLLGAVRDRREVEFSYTKPNDVNASRRRLQPWGVAAARGRWYVVGHDLQRGQRRSFRLSRIAGDIRLVSPAGAFEPPANVDLLTAASSGTPSPRVIARLAVRSGAAAGLRRRAEAMSTDESGRDIIAVSFMSVGWLAEQVVAAGPDVVVLEPPELRDEVIVRLKSLANQP